MVTFNRNLRAYGLWRFSATWSDAGDIVADMKLAVVVVSTSFTRALPSLSNTLAVKQVRGSQVAGSEAGERLSGGWQ